MAGAGHLSIDALMKKGLKRGAQPLQAPGRRGPFN